MPRQKRYYPVDEIVRDLYTFGQEYMFTTGEEYRGLYHRYTSTGEVYSGPEWNNKTSRQLIKFVERNEATEVYRTLNNEKVVYQTPSKYFVTITPQDIQKRSIKRYFLFKNNELSFIEIDKTQYNQVGQNIDPAIYQKTSCIWHIAGPIETVTEGNVTTPGVQDLNQREIDRLAKQYPQIRDFLTNPLEFYIDTDLIIPPDIN